MKLLIILCLILSFEYANANYCSYNVYGDRQFCMSDYKGCLSESGRRGIKRESDLCRKEEQTYPKSVDPQSAKKGTCLWMEKDKKWVNLGCMETVALCAYSEKQYKSQAKVECR